MSARAGTCCFCHCTEDNACKLPTGDPCGWLDDTRTVCTAPACLNAYFARSRREASDAAARSRKRTPAQIHELMKEERNAKRRAAREKRKQNAQRGAA